MFAVLKQPDNYLFPNMVCKTYIPIIELLKLNFDQIFFDFIRRNWRYNVNDSYNIKVVLLDANNLFS